MKTLRAEEGYSKVIRRIDGYYIITKWVSEGTVYKLTQKIHENRQID